MKRVLRLCYQMKQMTKLERTKDKRNNKERKEI